jgi:tetratricopeptide (TPR) repeat protein
MKRHTIYAASALLALAIAGCATTAEYVGPTFPLTPAAEDHYTTGNECLAQGRYELAAEEFQQSVDLEPAALLSHVRLGLALFGDGRFGEAAGSFQHACEMTGGPGTWGSASFCVLQAASLMRGSDIEQEQARQLLKAWSSPGIAMVGSSAISTGSGSLPGGWKKLAGYLLGKVSEDDILGFDHAEAGYFTYLFVGLDNARRGNHEEADACLRTVLANVHSDGWRYDLAKIELRRMASEG